MAKRKSKKKAKGYLLPKYQDEGRVKGWQGDRDAVNLMNIDGKKYSYNQLIELGYPDSTIVRNWNLDITPEPKSRTTMAESVMGFEQRPVEKTMTRGEAFKQARAAGEKEFTFEGKRYTTELASDKTPKLSSRMRSLHTMRPSSVPIMAPPADMGMPRWKPSSGVRGPGIGTFTRRKDYSAPYANMSANQIKNHIKQSWTYEQPYSTMPFVKTKHDIEDFENFPAEEMGFAYENIDDERTWRDPMVLSKNGNTPKALSLNWYKNAQKDDPEAAKSAMVELDDEGNKIYYKENPVSYRIDDVFDDPTKFSLDELRLVAANLDSVYDVSNPFNSPNTVINKIKSIDINPPSFSSPSSRDKGVDEVHTTTDSIPGKTKAKTIEFQYGGPIQKAQTGYQFPAKYLDKQAFVESTWDPKSLNEGSQAAGLTQFRPITVKDIKQRGFVDDSFDIYNPEDAVKAQIAYMNWLGERPFIDKPNQTEEIRAAKTLLAYNRGPDRANDVLTAMKNRGVDIYSNLDWVDEIPDSDEEGRNYIKMILQGQNTKKRHSVQENYQKALKDPKYKYIRDIYAKQTKPNSYTRPYKEGEDRSLLNLKNRNQPSIQRPFNPEFSSRVIDNTSEQEIPLSPIDLENINRIYDKKTTKEEIGNIQHKLDSLGYNIGSAGVDSLAGDSTELALKQFALDQVNDRPAPIDVEEPGIWDNIAEKFNNAKTGIKDFAKNAAEFVGFENGGEVESYQNGTEVVVPNSENEEVVVTMQQELPHQEIVSFPTEREPHIDPRVPKWADKKYYKKLYNTDIPKTLAKQYSYWSGLYKSPIGLPPTEYKDIYDVQAFFNSGDWRKGFKNIEDYKKPSHPMLGDIDPDTNTFVPDELNVNTNEEIADYILQENIPVNFKKVERIPINPDGFAPGSATEFADKVVIPSGNITMKDMQEPILANGEMLMPGDEAQFDTDYVIEEKLPKAQDGLKVEGKKLSKKEVDDVRAWMEDDSNFGKPEVHEYPYLLDEVTVDGGKYDRTNPTAVRNWSREHNPIAYAAREATGEVAPYVATGLGMAFAPAGASLLGAGARGLAAAGEATYGALAPYFSAPAVVGGTTIPGATIGNFINAGFGTHGATNIAPDALELLTNPLSLENLGNVGIDALEMAPMYGPMSKMLGELRTIGRVGKSSKPTSAAGSDASTPSLRMSDTELAAYLQQLEKQGVNLDNVKRITESERFSINELAKAHPDNKVNHILKAEDFLTDLSGSTKLIQSKIDNKVKLLESAEGYKRQLKIEKDYLKEIGVPKEEIKRLAPLNVDARITELKELKIGNKEIEEMHKAGTHYDPTSSSMFSVEAEKLFLKENLYNNAYYNRPPHIGLLDTYNPIKQNQLGREAVHGGSINFSKLFKNEGATIDHEISHAFNQRGRVLPLDDALREGITLRKNLNANQQNAAEYFMLGSQGKEPSSFLAEVKTSMIEAGLLKNEHSRVTPALVKQAQLFFEKNPRWILSRNKFNATSRYYSQHRLLDFMEATKSNFKLVADKLNQTNVLIPGIGVTAAGSAKSKD